MRVPVHQLRGKAHSSAKERAPTIEDELEEVLSKTYTVVREKSLNYVDEQGHKQTMIMDMAIPANKLLIEIQKKQDNKAIIAEMARDKVARTNGWRMCRLTEREAKGEDVLFFIKRSIERPV